MRRHDAGAHHVTDAAHAFHPDGRDTLAREFGQFVALIDLDSNACASRTLGQEVALADSVAGAVLAKIAVLVFIIIFIQRRPQGLFALKGREAVV